LHILGLEYCTFCRLDAATQLRAAAHNSINLYTTFLTALLDWRSNSDSDCQIRVQVQFQIDFTLSGPHSIGRQHHAAAHDSITLYSTFSTVLLGNGIQIQIARVRFRFELRFKFCFRFRLSSDCREFRAFNLHLRFATVLLGWHSDCQGPTPSGGSTMLLHTHKGSTL
jgi:hypothetical protein